MGLAERRKIAAIRDNDAPEYQRRMNETVGFELPLVLDIASFPEHPDVLKGYESYKDSYGPAMVIAIFKSLCADQLGRDAVTANIQKIIIENVGKSDSESGARSVTLKDGVLTLQMGFYGYSDQLYGEDELRTLLENML